MARLILKSALCFSLAVLLALDPVMARASWLSDVTGINIDIPKGQVTFGPPQPQAIVPQRRNIFRRMRPNSSSTLEGMR